MTAAPKADVLNLVETHRATLASLISEGNGSEASRLLVRRAAALATWCDAMEISMENGRTIDMAVYLKAVGALKQLLTDVASVPVYDITPREHGPRDLARAMLWMHHKAKIEGKLHLLDPTVLDVIASVQPIPEAPANDH
jgi:hypothetical protein